MDVWLLHRSSVIRLPDASTQTFVLLLVCHSLSELQPMDASIAAEIAAVSGSANFFTPSSNHDPVVGPEAEGRRDRVLRRPCPQARA